MNESTSAMTAMMRISLIPPQTFCRKLCESSLVVVLVEVHRVVVEPGVAGRGHGSRPRSGLRERRGLWGGRH